MRRPRRMSRRKSRRNFKRGAARVHKKNFPRTVMRGGIRL